MPIFSGLTNYIRMFVGDEMFLKTVSNTLVLSIITGPFSFLLAFLLAWLINEFNGIVRGFLAFLFYAPALAGNAYFIWQIAFSGDSYGYVNSLLLSVGLITNAMVQKHRILYGDRHCSTTVAEHGGVVSV